MAIRQPRQAPGKPKPPTRPKWQSKYHGVRMTPEQYLALPEEKPYLEYIDGMVVQKPMPTEEHGILVAQLVFELELYRRDHGGTLGPEIRAALGELPSYRLPDISFWAPDRPFGNGLPPSMGIEVRSRSQTSVELREKCRVFRRSGVDACWLIDPVSRTAELFEGKSDAMRIELLKAACLPGFELKVGTLFGRMDEQLSRAQQGP